MPATSSCGNRYSNEGMVHSVVTMVKFLLWLILVVLCWPLALAALILYPVIWLLLLPFRIVGIAAEGVLGLIKALFLFPARVLRGKQ